MFDAESSREAVIRSVASLPLGDTVMCDDLTISERLASRPPPCSGSDKIWRVTTVELSITMNMFLIEMAQPLELTLTSSEDAEVVMNEDLATISKSTNDPLPVAACTPQLLMTSTPEGIDICERSRSSDHPLITTALSTQKRLLVTLINESSTVIDASVALPDDDNVLEIKKAATTLDDPRTDIRILWRRSV